MKRFGEKLGFWTIRYRWAVMAATLLVVALCGLGVIRLSINTDNRVFFSDQNPQLRAFEALENTYTKDENVFIAVAPQSGTVFRKDVLAALVSLTEACWQLPYTSRVDSITNFQYTRVNGDELIVENLVRNAAGLTKRDLAQIQRIALAEPLLVHRLISPEGDVTGINVNVIKPSGSVHASQEIVRQVRKLADNFRRRHPHIDLHLTGWIMLENTLGEAAQQDMALLVPLMFALLIVVMAICLRSVAGTFATFVVIVFSIITAMGLAGWMGVRITAPSSNAPPIILTLALADSVHLLLTLFRQMRQGSSRYAAIVKSLRINVKPVFITSATTCIGFLTMNFSDAPPFRDLGTIVAIGVAAAFVYSVLFLPALIAVLPLRIKTSIDGSNGASMKKVAGFIVRRHNLVFGVSLLSCAVLTLGILRIELNDDFIQYFDNRYAFRVDSDFVMNRLTGLYTIEYSLNAGEENGINDPDYLKTIEAFAAWYHQQPHVVHVNSLTDIVKRLNQNMHADDPAYYRIPAQRDLAAQYLLLYEMSLPFGLDLNNQINVDKSSLRMIVTLKDITAKGVREIDHRARQWLRTHAPKQMYTYGTGLAVIYAHLSARNIKSMLGATLGALVLISLILMVAFRSFKFGLISLIPNLLPVFMAFGFWGFTMQRVGIPVSVLVALAVGIIVDDTVHLISNYLHGRRKHKLQPPHAVQYAFDNVGKALWVTTITLVSGFSVLSFSGFKPNSDMGILTSVIISFALIFDFMLLPAILLKIEEKANENVHAKHILVMATHPVDNKCADVGTKRTQRRR